MMGSFILVQLVTLTTFLLTILTTLTFTTTGTHAAVSFTLQGDPPKQNTFKLPPPPDPADSEFKDFFSAPNRHLHADFLSKVMSLILEKGVFFQEDRSTLSPYEFKSPEELAKIMDLSVGEDGTSQEELLKVIDHVLKYSPRSSHPYMLDKRVAGLDPYALAGDWLANTMSNLVVLYIVAPIYTLMERQMADYLGGKFGWSIAQGVSVTGTGSGNGLAVALALQDKWPDLKAHGMVGIGNPKPAIFVSEHCSIGFEKAQIYQGLAEEWVIKVKTEPRTGRLDMQDLTAKIQAAKAAGLVPTMLVATAGTPLLGAVDPIEAMAGVARSEGMWFHVDAGRGGGLIFGSRLKGLQFAQSVLFSGWIFQPPYVSAFLVTQRENALFRSFSLHASYVWTGISLYDHNVDTGDYTIQTSRRPEIAKFWFTFKARGFDNLKAHVDLVMANTQTFVGLLKAKAGVFSLWTDTHDSPQVAFFYVPPDQRGKGYDMARLNEVNKKIKIKLLNDGLAQLSLGDVGPHHSLFLIVTLTSSALTQADLQYIVNLIEHTGDGVSGGGGGGAAPTMPALPADLHTQRPWINVPIRALHEKFLTDTFQLFLKRGIFFSRKEKPSDFMQPETLKQKWDFELKPQSVTHDHLLNLFDGVIQHSPHWSHPYMIYQLATGLDPYTLAADYVASAVNTPMLTYEDNPVFTLMQNEVLKAFRKAIFGSPDGDGVFTDGGSMANQLPIAIARHIKDEHVKKKGIGYLGKQFVHYVSEDGHYSTRKGAIIQGIGGDHSIHTLADTIARMRMDELEKDIQKTLAEGNIPFMITLTVGTTIYGGIDNVEKGVGLCKKYHLWCHIDGMFGGLLALSDKHRHRAKGLEGVDSYGVDLHKLMGSTMVMSALITKHNGVFAKTFETHSPIEFSQRVGGKADGFYDKGTWDLGDHHWQTDKRNNLFKFWFLWKAKGRKGMAAHVDRIYENSAYLVSELKRRDGFKPVIDEFEVTNICLFFTPPAMRKDPTGTPEWESKQGNASTLIEKLLVKDNVINVVSQQRHYENHTIETPTFIKFVMMGSQLTKPDINYLLDTIEFYGNQVTQFVISAEQRRRGGGGGGERNRGTRMATGKFDPFGNNPVHWKEAHADELRRHAAAMKRRSADGKHSKRGPPMIG